MSKESKHTIISDNLIVCECCGSTDFCVVQESPTLLARIRCRQCNTFLGLLNRVTTKELI